MKYLVLFSLLTLTLQAKRFSNKYIAFELPPGWECALEGAEYVCQSTNKQRQKEAIIIMAAKERGPQDTLAAYQAYLQKKKNYTLPNRKKQVSEPRFTKVKDINKQKWIDSLHLASEVPGFFTRYLATIKGDLGVLVTYSVSKEHYNSYQKIFDTVISSMRVFALKKGSTSKFKLKKRGTNLLSSANVVDAGLGGPAVTQTQTTKKKKTKDPMADIIFYGIIALAVGAFIAIRRKKK